jgi:hypothetical protein
MARVERMKNLFCKVLLGLAFGTAWGDGSRGPRLTTSKELQTKAINGNKASWGRWALSPEQLFELDDAQQSLGARLCLRNGLAIRCGGENSIYRDDAERSEEAVRP